MGELLLWGLQRTRRPLLAVPRGKHLPRRPVSPPTNSPEAFGPDSPPSLSPASHAKVDQSTNSFDHQFGPCGVRGGSERVCSCAEHTSQDDDPPIILGPPNPTPHPSCHIAPQLLRPLCSYGTSHNQNTGPPRSPFGSVGAVVPQSAAVSWGRHASGWPSRRRLKSREALSGSRDGRPLQQQQHQQQQQPVAIDWASGIDATPV